MQIVTHRGSTHSGNAQVQAAEKSCGGQRELEGRPKWAWPRPWGCGLGGVACEVWPRTCTLHRVFGNLAFTYRRSCIFASQPLGGDSCPSDTPRPGVRLPDLLLFPASWKVCPSPQNWPQHLSLIFNHPRGQGHLKTLNHTREELCVWEAGWDCWAIWFRLTALSGPGRACSAHHPAAPGTVAPNASRLACSGHWE